MFKSLLLKIYKIMHILECWAIADGIYTESDLYDIRYTVGTQIAEMNRRKENEKI